MLTVTIPAILPVTIRVFDRGSIAQAVPFNEDETVQFMGQ
jgi:hypothetical protein